MPLILPGSAPAPVAYDIANSCRFNDGDSAYMEISPASDGSNTTATFSAWVKRCNLGARQAIFGGQEGTDTNNRCVLEFNASDQLVMQTGNAGSFVNKKSTRLFRDCSAWYHLVFQFDTTNGTAASRWKFFVNGVEETVLSTDQTFPDSADIKFFENTTSCRIAVGMKPEGSNNVQFFDGYMAEVVVIDGSVLAPTSFGEFDSRSPTIWKPKDVSELTFGTNGFYLDFEDSANLGNDANGGTDLTETNLDATDQATDTPTNNFATANPLSGNAEAFAQGNLHITNRANTDASYGACSTIGLIKGKWFVEIKCTAVGSGNDIGLLRAGGEISIAGDYQFSDGNLTYRKEGQKTAMDGTYSPTISSYGDSYATGDILAIALDMDNRDVYFYKNGVVQDSGTAAFTSSNIDADTFYFVFQSGYNTGMCEWNFGGCNTYAISSGNADANGYGNFEYAVPSGYYAICTKNLAEFG